LENQSAVRVYTLYKGREKTKKKKSIKKKKKKKKKKKI